jgi:hypothetical protein
MQARRRELLCRFPSSAQKLSAIKPETRQVLAEERASRYLPATTLLRISLNSDYFNSHESRASDIGSLNSQKLASN